MGGRAAFTDPRNINPTASGPTRIERAAFIKAITAQTNPSLFDVDVMRMQEQFADLEAKDIEDIVNAILVAEAPLRLRPCEGLLIRSRGCRRAAAIISAV